MEATIRIESEKQGPPKGGFAGALVGGTDPGDTQRIEVDLRETTGGDIAAMLPEIAEIYRKSFDQDVIDAKVVDSPAIVRVPEQYLDQIDVQDSGSSGLLIVPKGIPADDVPQEVVEPQPGDVWALTFDDGTGAAYIFDGVAFLHPKWSEGAAGNRHETLYPLDASVIASRRLIARGVDVDTDAKQRAAKDSKDDDLDLEDF
jgi:hypothetical protein